MVDTSLLATLTDPSIVLPIIAVILAIIAFAGYLRGRAAANRRKREIEVLSRAVEQLARLSMLEYRGTIRLGRSLARALNPTGDHVMESPEAKAAYQVLGLEPERILEEAELVLAQVSKALGWRFDPAIRGP